MLENFKDTPIAVVLIRLVWQTRQLYRGKEQTLAALNERSLVDLVDQAYEAALEPSSWPRCIETWRATFHADQAKFAYCDLIQRAGCIEVSAGVDPHFNELYRLRYARLNPYLRRGARELRAGEVVHGEMLLADEELIRTEFYNDYMRPQDLRYWSGAILLLNGETLGALIVSRNHRAGRFTAAELAFQRELLPHLQRGAALYRKFREIELTRNCLIETVESCSTAVLLLDHRARVAALNRAADELLAARDGLVLDSRRTLGATAPASNAALAQMIGNALAIALGLGRVPAGSMSVPRPSGKRPYSLQIAPIKSPVDARSGDLPYASVVVVDPDRAIGAAKEKLAAMFGLTGAEATLAVHLSKGGSLSTAATEMGVSLNTIRTHLKRIFSKTDTNRQAELVALLNTVGIDPEKEASPYSGISFPK